MDIGYTQFNNDGMTGIATAEGTDGRRWNETTTTRSTPCQSNVPIVVAAYPHHLVHPQQFMPPPSYHVSQQMQTPPPQPLPPAWHNQAAAQWNIVQQSWDGQRPQEWGNQPQQIIVLSLPTSPPAPMTKKKRRAHIICGAGEICSSVTCIFIGIAFLAKASEPWCIALFLSAVCGVVSGSLSVTAGFRGVRSHVIAALVLSIITAVVSGATFIFCSVMWGVFANIPDDYRDHYNSSYRSMTILFSISTFCNLSLVVFSIVQSSFSCASTGCQCCNEPIHGEQFAYIANPGQFGGPVVLPQGQSITTPMLGVQPGAADITAAPVLHGMATGGVRGQGDYGNPVNAEIKPHPR